MAAIQRRAGVMGGRLTLRGHRVTIAQMVAEIADRSGPKELAADTNWDERTIREALREIAMAFEAADNLATAIVQNIPVTE